MSHYVSRILSRRFLSLSLVALLIFPVLAGIAHKASATDLNPGWAIIVTTGKGWRHQEAKDLHNYLTERGWDEDQIVFLSKKKCSFRDGKATLNNFKSAIEYVGGVSSPGDIVFIAVLDHGVDGGDGDYFLRFGKRPRQHMSDTEFGEQLDSIGNYQAMVVDIAGSYSGGFIEEAEGDNRVIITDTDCTERYRKSEYTFSEALVDWDADTDMNGIISVEEAYELMLATMEDTSPQISDPDDDDDIEIPVF